MEGRAYLLPSLCGSVLHNRPILRLTRLTFYGNMVDTAMDFIFSSVPPAHSRLKLHAAFVVYISHGLSLRLLLLIHPLFLLEAACFSGLTASLGCWSHPQSAWSLGGCLCGLLLKKIKVQNQLGSTVIGEHQTTMRTWCMVVNSVMVILDYN